MYLGIMGFLNVGSVCICVYAIIEKLYYTYTVI